MVCSHHVFKPYMVCSYIKKKRFTYNDDDKAQFITLCCYSENGVEIIH